MLDKLIKGINDTKLAMIERLSGTENVLDEEADFIDDALLKNRIERLKKKSSEIELIIREDESKTEVMRQIGFEIIFLASNNIKNIESCLALAANMNTDFIMCLRGLEYYETKNYDKAYEAFTAYFKEHPKLLQHYLINKTYGLLLYSAKQYEKSICFLRKASTYKPEDIEIHKVLQICYTQLGQEAGRKVEKNIIRILEV